MAGRSSYFSEKREQNPNYFNRVTIDEIRKNVKRIIRDVKNGNISDQDYVYFQNNQVITACMQEAYENATNASVVVNALNYYMHEGVTKGVRLYPSIDLNNERMIVTAQQTEFNVKATVWSNLYLMFQDIDRLNRTPGNTVPPQASLQYIMLLSSRDMAAL